jgi:glycerophosphoryl diester phosphodiesterase
MTAGQPDRVRPEPRGVVDAAARRRARIAAATPESVLQTAGGRMVEIKAHRCLWSGNFPENSLPAIEECFSQKVSRAEIDLHMLRDADYVVLHDDDLTGSTDGTGCTGDLTRAGAAALRLRAEGTVTSYRPPLFSQVVAAIGDGPSCTLLELDIPAQALIPWPRIEELVNLIDPVRGKVHVNASAANVRRMLTVSPMLEVGVDPGSSLDWVPPGAERGNIPAGARRNSYGYFDQQRPGNSPQTAKRAYLAERLAAILSEVPEAAEIHVRKDLLVQMLDDGFTDIIDFLHDAGPLVDAWTINAGGPSWLEQLQRVVGAGADIVSSDTPRELRAAWSELRLAGQA